MSDRLTVLKIENVKKKYLIKHVVKSPDGRMNRVKQALINIIRPPKKEDFWALNGVNFDVQQGEKVGIIGKNGAGKSTLLKVISRITEPTDGRIEILGRVSSMLEVGTGFNMELTGRENVYLNGAILGMTRAEIDEKFDEIVEFSEVGKFIDTPVKRYSSGMFVRLAFAVASNLEPDILLVDEVLSVGDTKFQKKCIDKMMSIANSGKTILFVSHQMNTIRQLCNRVIVLKAGSVVYDGNVEGGIKIYNNDVYLERNNHYDYENIERPAGYDQAAKMLSLDILNNESCVYKTGEYIEFALKIKVSRSDLGDIGLRITVYSQEIMPVETYFSKVLDYIKLPGVYIMNVRMKINLAPGIYQTSMVLAKNNAKFVSGDLDWVTSAFSFETLLSDGISKWPKEWGGSHCEDIDISVEKAD